MFKAEIFDQDELWLGKTEAPARECETELSKLKPGEVDEELLAYGIHRLVYYLRASKSLSLGVSSEEMKTLPIEDKHSKLLHCMLFDRLDDEIYEPVDQAVKYIESNYHDSAITLDSMAKRVGMSSWYLSKKFKQETGYTFSRYLLAVRIESAKKLLIATRLTVSEIAIQTGFTNAQYFSQVFKKNSGISPSEFKLMAAAGGGKASTRWGGE